VSAIGGPLWRISSTQSDRLASQHGSFWILNPTNNNCHPSLQPARTYLQLSKGPGSVERHGSSFRLPECLRIHLSMVRSGRLPVRSHCFGHSQLRGQGDVDCFHRRDYSLHREVALIQRPSYYALSHHEYFDHPAPPERYSMGQQLRPFVCNGSGNCDCLSNDKRSNFRMGWFKPRLLPAELFTC
jgi:hypothetical protein